MPKKLLGHIRSIGARLHSTDKVCAEVSTLFDASFYRQSYPEVKGSDLALIRHYLRSGWRKGYDPSLDFSTRFYLEANPDVAQSGLNPLLHFARYGRQEGRMTSGIANGDSLVGRHPDAVGLDDWVDREFYLSSFSPMERPADPVSHFLHVGWKEGRDPAPWFSIRHYLAQHTDVAEAGVNPFSHYVFTGQHENRELVRLGRSGRRVFNAHEAAVNPGPDFEALDPTIGVNRTRAAKVLAFYLPQFHPVDVNDEHWGTGFSEWRNLPRAMPRFEGHVQPRIPRDLGFYDLAESDTLRRQVEMARSAGIHGFCFYYYWFDGVRVLEKPLERLLADTSIDFPFCLIWANENWTRTWDGADAEIILEQSYDPSKDHELVDDWARHMKDDRYIRLDDGRPLLIIYRPGQIPDAKAAVARWRQMFESAHGLNPVIMMVQGFGDEDPRPFGLDGAIEFPPHKLAQDLSPINTQLDWYDPEYEGHVLDYDEIVDRSLDEGDTAFPLVKTAIPSWDNDARRPGRGLIIHGGSPRKFEYWMGELIQRARTTPVFGNALVCVNAWNEWAEGAMLEPDVHFGGAYLNSVSRAVFKAPQAVSSSIGKIVIVGHDANRNGAQLLALNIGRTMRQQFGVSVTFLLADGGPLLPEYEAVGNTIVIGRDPQVARKAVRALRRSGCDHAITNTSATGFIVPILKREGFATLSLIHELPKLLASMKLQEDAAAIAEHSDRVVFPAGVVQQEFEEFIGPVRNKTEIFPQGIYNETVFDIESAESDLRAEMGLPPDMKIVLGVGYADLRKGIDRFVSTGLSICAQRDDICFIWLGAASAEAQTWFEPEILAAGMNDRVHIVGFKSGAERYFAAADVFYLSSREDPFPSVVLEALACGLPVVGHRGCGGCDGLIERFGVLVDTNGPATAEGAILRLLDLDAALIEPASRARRDAMATQYDFQQYSFGLLKRLSNDLVTVSVVVPNYNYEDFIAGRLNSVFLQSYPVREILVLDDASTDDSLKQINSSAMLANRHVSIHVNPVNSGSPFEQWRKGIELAQGDYVWIAEADDLASPEFIETIVGRMRKSNAVLGFCDSRQIDEISTPLGAGYKGYLNEIEPAVFENVVEMDGIEFLSRFLAVKNVILNASGVIFQRQALLNAFETLGQDLSAFSVAGDWRLYVEIASANGRVCYMPDAMNVHRRHRVSVTQATDIDKHLGEIESMHRLTRERVALTEHVLELQKEHYDTCAEELRNALQFRSTAGAPSDEDKQPRASQSGAY